jgi:hypothetical protein
LVCIRLARYTQENAFLYQRTARLEVELVEARTKVSRMDFSGAARMERASKMYRKFAARYHPDHNPATAEVMKDLNVLWQALKGAQTEEWGGNTPCFIPEAREESGEKRSPC